MTQLYFGTGTNNRASKVNVQERNVLQIFEHQVLLTVGKVEILFSQIIAMNSKTKVILMIYFLSKIQTFLPFIRPLQVLVKL